MSVRVRYAPSPTGLQHVGGLRTALINYLFARSQNGVFYLRLEDTDRSRYDPAAEADLYESLRWAGIDWDEGPDKGGPFAPYVQSQRLALYREAAERLVQEGKAYRCFCTAARLEELRKEQEAKGLPTGYDRRCRSLSAGEAEARAARGEPFTIRLAMPLEGELTVSDGLLGKVPYPFKDLPTDPVLLKSDGFPTYHLAHVVDDHAMRTTHVIRSQEWLPSLGLHVYLFQCLGWEPPAYFHLPLVLGPDGQKLSKRHGATSVRQFREMGYLPEGLVNGIALLGWSFDGQREYFRLADLIRSFRLEGLNKSAAVLDYKKLEHFNTLHIKSMPDQELVDRFCEYIHIPSPGRCESFKRSLLYLLPHLRERVTLLTQVEEWVSFLWEIPESWNDIVPKRLDASATVRLLRQALELLSDLEQVEENVLEERFRGWCTQEGVKLGDMLMPLRIALTGKKVSLPLFPLARVLGKEQVRLRVLRAIEYLENEENEDEGEA